MSAGVSRRGVLKRVNSEVEELVQKIAERTGYAAFTIRNFAILFGIAAICLGAQIPKDDLAFAEVLERVRLLVKVSENA